MLIILEQQRIQHKIQLKKNEDLKIKNLNKIIIIFKFLWNSITKIENDISSIYQFLTVFCPNYETCGDQISFSKYNYEVQYIQSIHYCRQLIISGSTSLNYFDNDTFIQNCVVQINQTTYNVSISCYTYKLYKDHFIKIYGGCDTYYFAISLTTEGIFRIHQGSDLSLTKTISLKQYVTELMQTQFYDFEPIENIVFSQHVTTINLLFISESLNYKFAFVYNTFNQVLLSFKYNYALSIFLDAKVKPTLSIDKYNQQAAISYQYKDNSMINVFNPPNNQPNDQTIINPLAQISIDNNDTKQSTIFYSIFNNVLMVPIIKDYELNECRMNYYYLDLRYAITVNDLNGLLYDQQLQVIYSNYIIEDIKVSIQMQL